MFTSTPFVFAILALSALVQSAPTPALDATTLLKNGQEAQSLNTAFQDLKTTDACKTGETACISGATAKCVNDKWKTKRCPSSLQCFALPSVKANGTIVTCTSERSALSIINATGAEGGIASNGTSNSTTADVNGDGCDGNSTSTSTSTATASSNNDPVTVTVTLGQQSTLSTSLSAETRTLSPDEASSLLSSIATGSSFALVSTVLPSSTPSAATTTAAPESQSGASQAAPTTILLTAASAAAPQGSTSSVAQVAAAAATSSAESSASAAGSSGSNYGY